MIIAIRLECEFRNEFVYKYMCESKGHVLRRPKDDVNVFAYTHKILTVIRVKGRLERRSPPD